MSGGLYFITVDVMHNKAVMADAIVYLGIFLQLLSYFCLVECILVTI